MDQHTTDELKQTQPVHDTLDDLLSNPFANTQDAAGTLAKQTSEAALHDEAPAQNRGQTLRWGRRGGQEMAKFRHLS